MSYIYIHKNKNKMDIVIYIYKSVGQDDNNNKINKIMIDGHVCVFIYNASPSVWMVSPKCIGYKLNKDGYI